MLKALDLTGWERTAWCVPSAVAMISGAPVGLMHSRAAFLRNEKISDVKGMFSEEAILLLHEQGYRVEQINLKERYVAPPTIQRFLKERTMYQYVMPILFSTHDHTMCAHMGYAGDNWTKKPVPVDQFPKLRRHVVEAMIVSKVYE